MSGTAAADLEREEEASSAGLSARCAAQASSASWRGIAYSENALLAYCIQWPWSGRAMRRHNAERNRSPKWIKYVRSAPREYAPGAME